MLNSLLPPGSRLRSAVFTTVSVLALLILTQLIFPGASGEGGTPGAILFIGGVTGLISALTAVGIILVYRTNRIINFAQAAIGATGSIFAYNVMVVLNWPYPVAFVLGVLIGSFLGVVVDLAVIRRFFDSPRLLLTAMTIALLGALFFLAITVANLPIFGEAGDRTLAERFGQEQVKVPFSDFTFNIGETTLDFGFAEVFAIVMTALTLAGVTWFLYRTRLGVAVRASSENTERASLLGIPIKMMSTVVWGIAGAMSAVALLLLGTVTDFTSSSGGGTTTLTRALAAAVIARLRSIPVAVAAAVGISVADRAIQWSYPARVELVDVGLLVLIVVGLLLQSRDQRRGAEDEAGSWKSVEEFRPIPRELMVVTGLRVARWALTAVFLIGLLLVPWILDIGPTNEAGRILIYAIALLSLVVLTGWAGQVSLGQFGLVAIGAVVGGALTSRLSVPFWVAVPAASVFSAFFAVLLGLTALRIRGFYLGVTTLAFAAAIQSVLFKEEYFGWLLPEQVERPTAFFLDFADERSMYYLALAGLLLMVSMVGLLRRTRPGRVFIGLRENQPNTEAFGINAVRTRIAAFALSGFIAGFAGVLLAHHQRGIDEGSYTAFLSLQLFIIAVVGGVGSVSGALIGAGYLAMQTLLANVSGPVTLVIGIFFGPIGLLLLLYTFPRGLSSVFYSLRDGVLRIVAQRRHIIVPSLFADYDPRAVEKQLAPLAAPDLKSGLGALPAGLRFRRASVLYATDTDGGRDGGRDEETKAFDAAVRSAVGEGGG